MNENLNLMEQDLRLSDLDEEEEKEDYEYENQVQDSEDRTSKKINKIRPQSTNIPRVIDLIK